MFSYDQIVVTSSGPTEIVAAAADADTTEVIILFSMGSSTQISFGDSGVALGTGLQFITPGNALYNLTTTLQLHAGDTLYAVSSSSGGVTVSYLATAIDA